MPAREKTSRSHEQFLFTADAKLRPARHGLCIEKFMLL
jgi:hypothetical protein